MPGEAENEDEIFILLPSRGLKARRGIELDFLTRFGGITSTGPSPRLSSGDFFRPIAGRIEGRTRRGVAPRDVGEVTIVDSVKEDGPKLVRMSAEAAETLERADTGLRAIKVRYYEPALVRPSASPRRSPPASAGASPIVVQIQDPAGAPVVGVRVVGFTSIANDEGAVDVTDAAGRAALVLGPSPAMLETLYVEAPPRDLWGLYHANFPLRQGDTLTLSPITHPLDDCVRRHCAPFTANAGAGVRIGIIDSGIGPHPDLIVVGGRNTVEGESRHLIDDNGLGHGTHVAGIIGGRGLPGGAEGIAPAAELWSGRVYGEGASRASNFAILKAMILATDADCDLLNLSLSADGPDPALQDAVTDAAQSGAVVLVATGNNGRAVVGIPARCNDAVGVSAFGIASTFPAHAAQATEVGTPANLDNFFASFANYGPEVRLIGPGVGVSSAALGGGYAIRSGTSMACAAITGMAARLLANDTALLGATRDIARSTAIQNMLHAQAKSLAFPFRYEGSGTL